MNATLDRASDTVNLFAPLPDVKILGDIVMPEVKGLKVPYAAVVRAIKDAGLPDDLAPTMLPRNAFARAAKKLEKDRIIRKLKDDREAGKLYFQSTLECKFTADGSDPFGQDRLDYVKETTLVLDKDTGGIKVDDPLPTDAATDLLAKIRAEFDDVMGHRSGADIGRMVTSAFRKNADLFPLKSNGGVYFCPARHYEFAEKVADFLAKVGGRLKCFPVPDAIEGRNNRHVDEAKQSVTEALAADVAEYRKTAEEFTPDATPAQMERLSEKLNTLRFKIESYSEYIDDRKGELLAQADDARETLKRKVRLAAEREERQGDSSPGDDGDDGDPFGGNDVPA